MPLPKPHGDETENDFISRCMGNPTLREDFPDRDQRLAVCFRQWREGKDLNSNTEHKSFKGIELKKEQPGSFLARIATLNVIDKDGDVTLPGAFPVGKTILVSAYMHGSWMGALPVGKGIIQEVGNEVRFEGEFNLNTEGGKAHYETIKFSPDLQEWSYGFIATDKEEDIEFEGNHVRRILKKVDVFEVSPVLRGAGMNTATLAIKSENNRGQTLADQTEMALTAVDGVVARVKALGALRREEGKEAMSDSTHERMMRLMAQMGQMMHDMQEMMDEEDLPAKALVAAGRTELLKLLRIESNLSEVN